MDAYRCPDCGSYTGPAPADGGPAACPRCRLPLDAQEMVELRGIDVELGAVEARRAALHRRRAALVRALRARRAAVAAGPARGAPRAGAPAAKASTGEAAPQSAQTVLLTLGGLLIVVAGLVFTLVNWSRFGIGGRAAVLTALTVLALAAPLALRRRSLDATAETMSAIGVALVLLDSHAARATGLAGLRDVHGTAYWSAVTGLVALGAAAYGRLTRSALMPYAALLLLQGTAPLAAVALHAHTTGLAYALLVSAVLNLVVATRMPAALRAAGGWTVVAGALAAAAAYRSDSYGPALRGCLPLVLAAALALAAARSPRLPAATRVGGAVLGGLALVGAAAVAPRLALPGAWAPLAAAVPAALLAGVALLRSPTVPPVGPVRRPHEPLWAGLAVAGALVLAPVALRLLPLLLRALGREAADGVVPVVAAILAALLAGAAVRFGRAGTAMGCGAVLTAAAAVVTAPDAAGLPYPVALATAGLPAVAAAAHLLRRPEGALAPRLCALLAPAAVALVWSLPHDAAALTVWGAAAVLAARLAADGRFAVPATAFAVFAAGYEAARAAAAAGLPPHLAAFAALGVAAATVPVAAALSGRVALTVEFCGYAVGAVAVLATAGHPDALSVALAAAGAAGAGLALRADRRTAGAIGAAALLAWSSWVRLALAGVAAPEPYTVSMSLVLLVLGHLRRRRDPGLGSWTAYGSGLASSLLPSLVAAWGDPHWLRPLLLGLTALALTLLGARLRLRAPLALGGTVLAADAFHELAPAVAQSIGQLPRWAPVAAAGILLLYLGATYERRLRAARRLRSNLRTLH
ncbi:SCO7613 C-terminal domain-containing membrane protein [Streptomyces sp. NPDC049040]|uniref:SCO7613 C-terminal domain-containing membrane protein n=1 Tax=Streptomyces sp. NPDC049040 TaxID=3365593 RepID=UPI00371A30BF